MVNGADISPDKARKMRAWFARHESDKTGQGFNPGEDGYPSAGRVAWALWGGDPAVSWSNKLVNQMDREDQKHMKRTSMDDAVWKNFIEKVQEPAEKQMQKAIQSYFDGYVQRIAGRLKDVVDPFRKSINARPTIDPDVIIKQ